MPTIAELEVLLKSTYKDSGGASKMLSDLDKISSSGSKLTGVMGQVNKAMGGNIFQGASQSFMKRNPHLFNQQMGGIMQSNNFLRQGANSLLKMGPLFPQYTGKVPPIIPPPGSGGAGFLGGFGGKFLGKLGLAGGVAGISAAATYKALQMAMSALTKTVKSLMDAFENARQLYAKALTSGGLGLGFTARREALASILGVSSKDVYQFGQAVLFLSPRLKFATDIMAKTTPNLAATSYEFKILKMNLEALFSVIANDGASSVRRFTSGLSEMIKGLTQFYVKFSDGISFALKGILESLGNMVSPAITAAIKSIIGGVSLLGKDSGAAPQPIAFMKQIQASAWERMGLVISGMGGANPQVETARNTKATADGVKQLVRAVGGKGGNYGYHPFTGAQSYQ